MHSALDNGTPITIAEVAEQVDGFAPEDIHTPHVYVDRVVPREIALEP